MTRSVATFAVAALLGAGLASPPRPKGVRRLAARDLIAVSEDDTRRTFGLPSALAVAADAVYAADADDHEVRVFSRSGDYLRTIGRPGKGPGELQLPSGIAAAGDAVFVADAASRRILRFEKSGAPAGGFPVPFAPDSLLEVGPALVAGGPAGAGARGGPLLRAFTREGRPLWTVGESAATPQPVLDALRNQVLALPWEDGFVLVHRAFDRTLRFYARDGRLLRSAAPGPEYPRRSVRVPVGGKEEAIEPFCTAAAADGGRLYLLAPEPTPDGDLGPGRTVFLLDREARVRGALDLPDPLARFAVAGDRIYGVDLELRLRVLRIETR